MWKIVVFKKLNYCIALQRLLLASDIPFILEDNNDNMWHLDYSSHCSKFFTFTLGSTTNYLVFLYTDEKNEACKIK